MNYGRFCGRIDHTHTHTHTHAHAASPRGIVLPSCLPTPSIPLRCVHSGVIGERGSSISIRSASPPRPSRQFNFPNHLNADLSESCYYCLKKMTTTKRRRLAEDGILCTVVRPLARSLRNPRKISDDCLVLCSQPVLQSSQSRLTTFCDSLAYEHETSYPLYASSPGRPRPSG